MNDQPRSGDLSEARTNKQESNWFTWLVASLVIAGVVLVAVAWLSYSAIFKPMGIVLIVLPLGIWLLRAAAAKASAL